MGIIIHYTKLYLTRSLLTHDFGHPSRIYLTMTREKQPIRTSYSSCMWQDHESLWENEEERRLQGKPIGQVPMGVVNCWDVWTWPLKVKMSRRLGVVHFLPMKGKLVRWAAGVICQAQKSLREFSFSSFFQDFCTSSCHDAMESLLIHPTIPYPFLNFQSRGEKVHKSQFADCRLADRLKRALWIQGYLCLSNDCRTEMIEMYPTLSLDKFKTV